MTWLAGLLATTAVLAWRPPDRWRVRHRLATGSPGSGRPPTALAVAAVIALGVPVVAVLPGPRVVLALTVAGATAFAVRQVRWSRRRRGVQRRRLEVADVLGLLAAELRAGILPARALAGLAADFPVLVPAARAADVGGDVPASLRSAALEPGRELLADVAGAWLVADRAGAPLAQVLERLEASSRTEREVEREVESGLAPARATGRLMAVLPAVGLLLGSGMGGDPVGVLTGTWPGVLCLAVGVSLACAGTAWVERIALTVEREL